jgi:hypothetical protein
MRCLAARRAIKELSSHVQGRRAWAERTLCIAQAEEAPCARKRSAPDEPDAPSDDDEEPTMEGALLLFLTDDSMTSQPSAPVLL